MKPHYYYDRKHGGCLRVITNEGQGQYRIKGAYGNDETEKGYWFANAEETTVIEKNNSKYNLIVDFSEKKEITHDVKQYAYKFGRKIYWEDGNIWKELHF